MGGASRREWVHQPHTSSVEVFDISRNQYEIMDECGRRDLLVNWIFRVAHSHSTLDLSDVCIEGEHAVVEISKPLAQPVFKQLRSR